MDKTVPAHIRLKQHMSMEEPLCTWNSTHTCTLKKYLHVNSISVKGGTLHLCQLTEHGFLGSKTFTLPHTNANIQFRFFFPAAQINIEYSMYMYTCGLLDALLYIQL